MRLSAAHGGQVINVQLALAAVADPVIANHRVPVRGAGGSHAYVLQQLAHNPGTKQGRQLATEFH